MYCRNIKVNIQFFDFCTFPVDLDSQLSSFSETENLSPKMDLEFLEPKI